jgi:hypothetical protein
MELCGCGRPVRYLTPGNEDGGSCNKYMRCPTYEDIRSTLKVANRRLLLFQEAVNKIDDYFEYSMESKKDQKKVFQILGNLTDKLAKNT